MPCADLDAETDCCLVSRLRHGPIDVRAWRRAHRTPTWRGRSILRLRAHSLLIHRRRKAFDSVLAV